MGDRNSAGSAGLPVMGEGIIFFSSFLCGAAFFFIARYFPLASAVLFLAACLALFGKRRTMPVLVLSLGFIYATLRFAPDPVGTGGSLQKEIVMTGSFPEAGARDSEKVVKAFDIDSAADADSGIGVEGLSGERVYVFSDKGFPAGKRHRVLLRSGGSMTRLNPGMPPQGLFGTAVSISEIEGDGGPLLWAFDDMRRRLNTFVAGRFGREAAGLIAAVTTGDASSLGGQTREAFNVSGLSHILSISGTHFGLLFILLYGTAVILIRRLPLGALERLTLYITPRQAAALICLPFLVFYLGISGASVPAVRSFLMVSLFLGGLLIGRRGAWLNSVLFAAFLLVIWDPGVILNLSFHLSFIAVICIGFSVEGRNETLTPGRRGVKRYLADSLRLTLVASLGTAPLVAYTFHTFSLISPLANLIAGPVIGFALIPPALVSSFFFFLTGSYIFAPIVGGAAELSLGIVNFLAGIPHASLGVPAFPRFLCVLFYWALIPYLFAGRRRWMLLLPFLPFLIYATACLAVEGRLTVTFLDVGQGDSAVIELPGGKTIVIDTGRTGRETAGFLRYLGKEEIDALILTHVHPDHTGGLLHLKEKFRVKEVWDNGRIRYPNGLLEDLRHRTIERGDIIEAEGCVITVLHPHRGFYTAEGDDSVEENNSSLVLEVSGRSGSVLFTGDTGKEAEEDMLQAGSPLKSDVLKVGHHGSRSSLTPEFLSAVAPSMAVISAGRDNPFGHPSPAILEMLKEKPVYVTSADGAIRIRESGKGWEATTCREDFSLREPRSLNDELKNIGKLFSRW